MPYNNVSPVQLPLPDPTDEIWKPIPGYDGRYEASTFGRIRRVKDKMHRKAAWRDEIMKPLAPDKHGYVRIGLMRGRAVIRTGVHQLIALTFLGACPEGCEINHINLDKSNNRLDNLEYITHAANMEHARHFGVWHTLDGERNPSSKLTADEVRAIRASSLPQRELAAQYGVTQVAIHYVVTRQSYREVDD